jgi:hypothetical protein
MKSIAGIVAQKVGSAELEWGDAGLSPGVTRAPFALARLLISLSFGLPFAIIPLILFTRATGFDGRVGQSSFCEGFDQLPGFFVLALMGISCMSYLSGNEAMLTRLQPRAPLRYSPFPAGQLVSAAQLLGSEGLLLCLDNITFDEAIFALVGALAKVYNTVMEFA